MTIYLVAICILAGSFFILAASLGVLRFPSLFMRMHASSKAGTLGGGFLLLAACFYFKDFGITTRCLAALLFLFATAPLAGHAIGRSAYFSGMKLWGRNSVDELRDKYDQRTHALISSRKKTKGSPRRTTARF